MRLWIILVVFLNCFLPITNTLYAQDFKNEKLLIKGADDAFYKGEYKAATPIFSQLVGSYSKDPNYNFKYGACLLYSGTDKERPIKYLQFAVSKPEVDPLAYYYYAVGLHLNYEFVKAIKYYKKFQTKGKDSDVKKFEVGNSIVQCENGTTLLKTITDLIVLDKKDIKEDDFYKVYDLTDFGGQILVKIDEFQSDYEKKNKIKDIFYFPKNAEKIFFTQQNSSEGSKDIYYKIRNPNGTWSESISMGRPVNTKFDEDYPFMHPDGTSLYFASKGHNSLGGYDIFVTRLDAEGNWTEPKNLDFAINTPADDYLFITDMKGETAYFTSNRETPIGEVSVYRINMERVPLDFAFVYGSFNSDKTKKAHIKVVNAETQAIIGEYDTDENGKYKIKLPNEGKFNFIVDYENSTVAHSGLVEIQSRDAFKPLKQTMEVLRQGQADEKLVIKNLVDEEVEEDVQLTADYLKQKAKLKVNKEKYNDRQKKDPELVVEEEEMDNTPISNGGEFESNSANGNETANVGKAATSIAIEKKINEITEIDGPNVDFGENKPTGNNSSNKGEYSAANSGSESGSASSQTGSSNNKSNNSRFNSNRTESANGSSSASDEELNESVEYKEAQKLNEEASNENSASNSGSSDKTGSNEGSGSNNSITGSKWSNSNEQSTNETGSENERGNSGNNSELAGAESSPNSSNKASNNSTLDNNNSDEGENPDTEINKDGLVVSKSKSTSINNNKNESENASGNNISSDVDNKESALGSDEENNASASPGGNKTFDYVPSKEGVTVGAAVATSSAAWTPENIDPNVVMDVGNKEDLNANELALLLDSNSERASAFIKEEINDQLTKSDQSIVAINNSSYNKKYNDQFLDLIEDEGSEYEKAVKTYVVNESKLLDIEKEITYLEAIESEVPEEYQDNLIERLNNLEILQNNAFNNVESSGDRVLAMAQTEGTSDDLKTMTNESRKALNIKVDPVLAAEAAKEKAEQEDEERLAESEAERKRQEAENNAKQKKPELLSENNGTNNEEGENGNVTGTNAEGDNKGLENSNSASNNDNNAGDQTENNRTQGSGNGSNFETNRENAVEFNSARSNQSGDNNGVNSSSENEVSENGNSQGNSTPNSENIRDEGGNTENNSSSGNLNGEESSSLENKNSNSSSTNENDEQNESSNSNDGGDNNVSSSNNTANENSSSSNSNNASRTENESTSGNENSNSNATSANNSANKTGSLETSSSNSNDSGKSNRTNNASNSNTTASEVGKPKTEIVPGENTNRLARVFEAPEKSLTEVVGSKTESAIKEKEMIAVEVTEMETSLSENEIKLASAKRKERKTFGAQVEQQKRVVADAKNQQEIAEYRITALERAADVIIALEPGEEKESEKEVKRAETLKVEAEEKFTAAAEKETEKARGKKKKAIKAAAVSDLKIEGERKLVKSTASKKLSGDLAELEEEVVFTYKNTPETMPVSSKRLSQAEVNEVRNTSAFAKYDGTRIEASEYYKKAQVAYVKAEKLENENKTKKAEILNLNNKLDAEGDVNEITKLQESIKELQDAVVLNEESAVAYKKESKDLYSEYNHTNNQAVRMIKSQEPQLQENLMAYANQLEREGRYAVAPIEGSSLAGEDSVGYSPDAFSRVVQGVDDYPEELTDAIFDMMDFNKSLYNSDNPVPVDTKLPSGVVFKVQIGAFRQPPPDDVFKGFAPVRGENTRLGWVRYTAGLFTSRNQAQLKRNEIRAIGYSDAFVVAYKDGKRIGLSEAEQLITDGYKAPASYSNTADASSSPSRGTSAVAGEVIPVSEIKGLLYTVQVGAFRNRFTAGQLFGITPLIEYQKSGLYKYGSGVYNDKQKAEGAKSQILGAGVVDAFVTAFYNGKRISLNEAATIAQQGPNVFAKEAPVTVGASSNTNNGNIVFRVQVGAYRQEVPLSDVKIILSLSNLGLDVQQNEGLTTYTVGRYGTYNDAKQVLDRVKGQGLNGAFVVSFENGKKIEVQEALRKLGQ